MSEWLDIETAPKDGRPIKLGWKPNIHRLEYEATSVGWDGHGWQSDDGGYWTDATHWKPVEAQP